MADKNEVAAKIDTFLKGKKLKSGSSKSIIPLKKLLNCDWNDEEHLKDTALECFAEMFDSDEEAAGEFRKQLFEKTKGICENVIKMYMVNNDLDMLPPRG